MKPFIKIPILNHKGEECPAILFLDGIIGLAEMSDSDGTEIQLINGPGIFTTKLKMKDVFALMCMASEN